MTQVDYGKLSMDELVDELRDAAEQDTPGDGQEAGVNRINAIKREMDARDGAMDRYVLLLSDPSTHVRYTAALSVQWQDPDRAYHVFRTLVDEPKSTVQLKAQMAIYQLEDSGRLKA